MYLWNFLSFKISMSLDLSLLLFYINKACPIVGRKYIDRPYINC